MQELNLVPVQEIPEAQDAPTDNLVKLYATCLLMEQVCLKNHGIGLSAVQVGVPWRLFVVRTERDTFEHFVNCKYLPEGEGRRDSVEGCLSIRTDGGDLRRFLVSRYKKVRIVGHRLSLSGGKLSLAPLNFVEDDELYSIVYQHEIDHTMKGTSEEHGGILISDIGKEIELR